ncbi:hypothetical protein [Streptomyces cyaneofuscatus]|uniref:hypothetical protein n=1 Tax=Streptomyces cyaneofuscatus TaxID=66883 RepID=UPI0037B4ECE5
MSGQGAGLEVPWSRRHRERLLTGEVREEYLTSAVVRTVRSASGGVYGVGGGAGCCSPVPWSGR